MVTLVLFVILLLILLNHHYIYVTKPRALANSPPMGWNSWDCFRTDFDETKIKEIVDSLIHLGLDQKGYKYIILDDGWMDPERDADGKLQGDRTKFPSGMKSIGQYIHNAGLKFGIYTSIGRTTCEGLPGSFDNEYLDAATFAEWGVDYVKIDWCTHRHLWWPLWNYKYRYQVMSDAIQRSGRDMVIALCNWGFGHSWVWGREIAHTWRITFDIRPTERSINSIIEKGKLLAQYNRPNEWNDLDCLQIGNGISEDLAKHQFYWWCVLKSPLILGCDLRYLSETDYAIITNDVLISTNQTFLSI
jgi:alpha-galactosidase